MSVNKHLVDTCNSINEQLNGNLRTKQSVIDQYLPEILKLKDNGVSYKKILQEGGVDISYKHFTTLVFKAKEKQTKPNHQAKKNQPTPVNTTKDPDQTEINIIDWKFIMPDIAERLVQDLMKHGYSIDTVKDWIINNKIPNSRELRLFFNKIKNKK